MLVARTESPAPEGDATRACRSWQHILRLARAFEPHGAGPQSGHSTGKRIGAKLEPHNLGPVLLAAFQVKHGARGVGRPQRSAFPAAVRIVDAAFRPFG